MSAARTIDSGVRRWNSVSSDHIGDKRQKKMKCFHRSAKDVIDRDEGNQGTRESYHCEIRRVDCIASTVILEPKESGLPNLDPATP